MLIDSHCHLDDDRFDDDRHDMMERARAVGIHQFVIPATTLKRWHKVRAVADEFAGVYPAYGLHPMFMDHHQFIFSFELIRKKLSAKNWNGCFRLDFTQGC